MVIIGVVVLVALFAGEDRRQDALRVLALLLRRPEPKPPIRRLVALRLKPSGTQSSAEKRKAASDGGAGPTR